MAFERAAIAPTVLTGFPRRLAGFHSKPRALLVGCLSDFDSVAHQNRDRIVALLL